MEKRSLFIQNSLKENLTLSQTKTVVGAERCVQDLLNTRIQINEKCLISEFFIVHWYTYS